MSGPTQTVIIDANNHMLGRLSSVIAKHILCGQHVVCVRCEEVVLSGGLVRQKMRYERFLRKRHNTKPSRGGPFHFRAPSKILLRTIRGMVPHKTKRGEAALKRLSCYEGIPTDFLTKKRMVVPEALKVLRLQKGHKFVKLGKLSSVVGWKHKDAIEMLENRRKEESKTYFAEKKKFAALKAKATKAADEELAAKK